VNSALSNIPTSGFSGALSGPYLRSDTTAAGKTLEDDDRYANR